MIKAYSVLLALCFAISLAACGQTASRDGQGPITISDAKSLLTQIPEFLTMAQKGWTYYFGSQKARGKLNGVDFYFFEVFARQKGEKNADLVGHFAVNKWTGDVRDISADLQGREISSLHIREMQKQLQQKYNVSQRRIEEERHAHTEFIEK